MGERGPSRSCGARIQPSRRPPQKLLLALPIVIAPGEYAANGPRHLLALQRQRLVRLVDDRHGAGAAQVGGVRLALGVGHQQAGGVLEVRDQVGQPRAPSAAAPRRTASRSQPSGSTGEAPSRAPPVPHRLGRVGVDRRLDQHPVARTGERLGDDRGRGQRAGRDHDLLGVGRQPARVVGPGDRRLELGQPGREVAVAAEVGRQLGPAASAYAAASRAGREGAAQLRSIASWSPGRGSSARSWARARPPGTRVKVPEPCRASAYPASRSAA